MVTRKTAIVLIILALVMFTASYYISMNYCGEELVPQASDEDLNPDVAGGQVKIVINPPAQTQL